MRGPIPTSTDCSVALVVSPTVCEVDKKTKATKQSSASTAGSCRASGEQWHERHEWSDRRQQSQLLSRDWQVEHRKDSPTKNTANVCAGKKRNPSEVTHNRPNPHGMTLRGKSTNVQTSQGVRRKLGTDTAGEPPVVEAGWVAMSKSYMG